MQAANPNLIPEYFDYTLLRDVWMDVKLKRYAVLAKHLGYQFACLQAGSDKCIRHKVP